MEQTITTIIIATFLTLLGFIYYFIQKQKKIEIELRLNFSKIEETISKQQNIIELQNSSLNEKLNNAFDVLNKKTDEASSIQKEIVQNILTINTLIEKFHLQQIELVKNSNSELKDFQIKEFELIANRVNKTNEELESVINQTKIIENELSNILKEIKAPLDLD